MYDGYFKYEFIVIELGVFLVMLFSQINYYIDIIIFGVVLGLFMYKLMLWILVFLDMILFVVGLVFMLIVICYFGMYNLGGIYGYVDVVCYLVFYEVVICLGGRGWFFYDDLL